MTFHKVRVDKNARRITLKTRPPFFMAEIRKWGLGTRLKIKKFVFSSD